MVDAEFLYTYEYQGNIPKLVHTPLLDKCYLVLTKGMQLGYGGNPYGPAGTGKTESVKALGNALGRQVLVFNCDEGIDFKSMGRIFIGIIKCGSWGCFDEFNRLKADQLSALSQMIQSIQEALKNKDDSCVLLRQTVNINEHAGIFVTLNPAGKSYGGRTKLPDNLKQLFREVVMNKPDNELITSTMLLSEGFIYGKNISKKIIELYKLCQQLLTRQQHYDWGLRSLKSILCLAGHLMYTWKTRNGNKQTTEEMEINFILQSLRINTLSKLTYNDSIIFKKLLLDIFPNSGVNNNNNNNNNNSGGGEGVNYEELHACIHKAVGHLHLQLVPQQVEKVMQLYEIMKQRMGIIIIGPSGSGKSTLIHILKKSLELLHNKIPFFIVNPKSISRTQLLGHMDADTREWYDGVVSSISKKVIKFPAEEKPWILFDGHIDPEWIESLNSVLDDNKLLTLPNGVRVQFGNNVNFLFETNSLEFASPATVSRMGIMLCSEADVSCENIIQSFLEKNNNNNNNKEAEEEEENSSSSIINTLIQKYLMKVMNKVMELKHCFILSVKLKSILKTCLIFISHAKNEKDFVFLLLRSLLGVLSHDGVKEISHFIFELTNIYPVSSKRPLQTYYDHRENSLVEFREDFSSMYADPSCMNINEDILIKTVDVQNVLETIKPLIHPMNYKPFFLVGPEGCGKSMLLQYCFSSSSSFLNNNNNNNNESSGVGKKNNIKTSILHCNAQTRSLHLIQKIEELCILTNTNSGYVYKPKDYERIIIIIKNINLPKPDKYNTIELHEFLLQLIMYSGFYNHELEWVKVENIQLIATMNLKTSLGYYKISPRLLSHVCIVSMSYPSRGSLVQIYKIYFSLLLRCIHHRRQQQQRINKEKTGGEEEEEDNMNMNSKRHEDSGQEEIISYDGNKFVEFLVNVFEKIQSYFEGKEEKLYNFLTPRNITKCIKNILMYSVDSHVTTLPAVLAHECMCVFVDCLSKVEDKKRVEKIISDSLVVIGYSLPPKEETNRLMFVSWLGEEDTTTTSTSSSGDKGQRKLLRGVSYESTVKEIEKYVIKYTREFQQINIYLIPEIIEWITHIDRILIRPVSHLILVGRPGVGRRTAIYLIAYIHRIQVVTLHMAQGYNIKNFKSDMKQFIQRATLQNEHMLLLLDDYNIVEESFLEIINSFISNGEIPGLFTGEELETMLSSLKEDAMNDGFIGTMYSYFLHRLRRNLHIALLMDNHNSLFSIRLQSNPGLMSYYCDILFLGAWSNETYKVICKTYLRNIIKQHIAGGGATADTSGKGFHLHRELFIIHDSFGSKVTPNTFQLFMETYEKILSYKVQSNEHKLKRLQGGLEKLKEAEGNVDKIRLDVTQKKEEVTCMQEQADSALTEIQKKMEESKEERDNVRELQEKLKEEHGEIITRREKIEEELSGIKPSLEAAREAVNSIRSEQLNEIRSLKSPPEPVRDVLEGVLALLGITDISWQSMRKFLGERGAKERILDFNAEKITPSIRYNVSRLLHQKAASFKPEVVYRASIAAAPMAAWVKAMVDYSTILERISPLNEELQHLEANQKEGEEKLHVLKKKLKDIDKDVENLREEFSKKCKEAERLKDVLEKAEKKLTKTTELLEKLNSEKTRWLQDIEKIETNNHLLPKRTLISAAFITYITKETEDSRQEYVKKWSNRLNFPSPMNMIDFMQNESDILKWKSEGLPRDDLSVENAIAILHSVQTPFIIDPSNQAIEWVKNHYKESTTATGGGSGISGGTSIDVISIHDERFSHTLELAVRFGKMILILDVDKVEPILYPLLRKDLFSIGAKKVIQVGNKQVDWQDTFRMMLFTRRTDLSLPPCASALLLEVNFSVTRFGLENQLLGITIQHERPELEKQRVEIIEKEEKLKIELNKLEEQLLYDLATSHGNLLENATLIGSLNDIKVQATSITEALQQSHVLQVELDEKRSVYSPFAHKGSIIFFLVKDMERMNRMYHFGLQDFIDLFVECLNKYTDDTNVERKIEKLTLCFAQKCFFHVSLGLLKCDQLVFGMHLIQGFFPDLFPLPLWNAFIGISNSSLTDENNNNNNNNNNPHVENKIEFPSWAPATSRTKFISMTSHEAAIKCIQKWNLHDNERWSRWMVESTPEDSLGKNQTFSFIEQLLIINTFRPDRLSDFMHRVIMDLLKLDTLIPITSLEDIVTHGKSTAPIILITSDGTDPSLEIQDIALRVVGKKRFKQVALGGGQTDDAMSHLHKCSSQGDWLLLKNLHLVLDWASVLEKEVCTLPTPNPEFRLIITTEPHDLFPIVLLRMSMKVTVETPPGMKQNLLQSYAIWDENFLQEKTKTTSQVLFGLAWFHALLQERRSYVPQGWIKFYEFSSTDLKSAADILCTLSRDKMDWTTVRGLLQDCIYGGRLETSHDNYVLEKLIRKIFNDETLVSCAQKLYDNTHIPATNVHRAIVQFIREHLPDTDSPAILSLPDNADRSVKEQSAVNMRENLRSFSNLIKANVSATDAWRTLLTPVLEKWSNTGIAAYGSTPSTTPSDKENPMSIFFMSELELLFETISNITETFNDLHSLVAGTLIPSLELREKATELIDGRVPLVWLDLMDGPNDLNFWLALLRKRVDVMMNYIKRPFSPSSESFDLMDFLRPQTFLNALRLYTSRTGNGSLVDLVLVAAPAGCGVADDLPVSVTLKGKSIHVQGALINSQGAVSFVSANSPSSVPLACDVRAGWAMRQQSVKGVTSIPMYTNAERTTTVMEISLRCDAELGERMLIGGVAAFLMAV